MGIIPTNHRRRWSGLLPLFAVVIVVGEVAFLGHLDMVKNAAMVQNWTNSFNFPSSSSSSSSSRSTRHVLQQAEEEGWCREWLEKEDNVSYARNFEKDPVLVDGSDQDWSSCTVGCKFGFLTNKIPDAVFGLSSNPATATLHRSMESSQYYVENDIYHARRRGYSIIMTTSLSSDVPVGYFSWAEYDIMAPMQPKTAGGLAAAFISNCGAHNFRLQALEMLEKLGIKIDSYGGCHRNRDGNVDKLETLKRYKFSLAFENSNEDDYVTEKFFQSLVAGAIPVVVGAPNIQDFAPSPNSILHIRELGDVTSVAETMKYLAENPTAYNKTLSWKFDGPSDSFKALVDMAAVHSSCRLCVHIATSIHEKEEASSARFQKRPCKCSSKMGTLYHLYVRERGRFNMESIFLSSQHLTLEALEFAVLRKFKSLNHLPIWKSERPESLRGGDELRVYRIYPVGLSQRQALYSFSFESSSALRKHIETHPCSKFEVIFV
ncbi:glycoprotein 3-alpha-L-fucosyltransferase A [Dendrobium catenatum]|uniref:glycoprotein 3-alpha-L-fucosyltransferase A n=1 Tax=Dendrobium catenatum TaxID=906689 RepID=UPI0009F3F952|nr:glycoprotein 3-alpha-L-fucosyltransferase A [Dendrobium catenatum]